MAQLSNIDRRTKCIRIPKKYEFTVKAFAVWLRAHPDQALLWNSEEFLQACYEETKGRPGTKTWNTAVTRSMNQVFKSIHSTRL